jgi:hypothetical protein
MQAGGDEFLAGSAFADGEYRRGQRGRARYVLQHFEEHGRLPDDWL